MRKISVLLAIVMVLSFTLVSFAADSGKNTDIFKAVGDGEKAWKAKCSQDKAPASDSKTGCNWSCGKGSCKK